MEATPPRARGTYNAPPDHTFDHLTIALTSADAAWEAASQTGTTHLTHVASTLYTLRQAATPGPQSVPFQPLAAHLASATQSLAALHRAHARLRAVIKGLRRWQDALITPSRARAAHLTAACITALEADLARKAAVIAGVQSATRGGAVLVERWLAEWVEPVAFRAQMRPADLAAVLRAEQLLCQETEKPQVLTTPSPQPARNAKDAKLSPALAMLKGRTR